MTSCTSQKNARSQIRRLHFTLVEIMVVIVILVMLASVATPLYFRHLKTSRIATAKTQIQMIEQALADYRIDVGDYPEELHALTQNVSQAAKWDGPYIKPSVPKDPWGREYIYVFPGENGDFDLVSYGKDGRAGGTGEDADITNYAEEE